MIIDMIKQDLLVARRNKDKNKGVLSALVSEIVAVGKNKGNRHSTDEEALVVVTKFVKNLKELIKVMNDNNLATRNEEEELAMYIAYLPTQMSKQELETKIGIFLQTESKPNMGQVMGYLKSNFNGQYDGKMASVLVREILA